MGKNKSKTMVQLAVSIAATWGWGVFSAKWPAHYNYEDGADWWLRKNAKKYDYSYSKRATSSYLK